MMFVWITEIHVPCAGNGLLSRFAWFCNSYRECFKWLLFSSPNKILHPPACYFRKMLFYTDFMICSVMTAPSSKLSSDVAMESLVELCKHQCPNTASLPKLANTAWKRVIAPCSSPSIPPTRWLAWLASIYLPGHLPVHKAFYQALFLLLLLLLGRHRMRAMGENEMIARKANSDQNPKHLLVLMNIGWCDNERCNRSVMLKFHAHSRWTRHSGSKNRFC